MLDLMKIARTEADGGDLLGLLGALYEPAPIKPTGCPNAIVWQGGNFSKDINPVGGRSEPRRDARSD